MIGTTPTHRFHLPMDTSILSEIRVVYHQRGTEVLRKETEHVKLDGNTIVVGLTQEETFLFDHVAPVAIQLRVKEKTGKIWKSPVYKKTVTKCLDTEVL